MSQQLHFLRPEWLLFLPLLVGLTFLLLKKRNQSLAWSQLCDAHLLNHLVHIKGNRSHWSSHGLILGALLFMIISLSGPSWTKLPVPTYKTMIPHVLILDMSESMLETDLTPNRLSRAKFKIRDLIAQHNQGQFALLAFTEEPFIVSPLTDDGETISSLLESLTPDIMPIQGQNLELALQEANKLIKQAGYQNGQILVLTSNSPSAQAISLAQQLAQHSIYSSIMPMVLETNLNPLYSRFSQAGQGLLLPYSVHSDTLEQWLHTGINTHYSVDRNEHVPVWNDEGRWFLIPVLCFLLPLFQRNWLQRINA